MLEITASSSCRDRHARSRWSSFGVKLQRRRFLVKVVVATGPALGEAGRAGIHYTSRLPALGIRQGKYSEKSAPTLDRHGEHEICHEFPKIFTKMGNIPT